MADLTVGQFLDYASRATVVTLLAAIVFALYRGLFVPRWVVQERDERIKRLEERNERWEQLLTRTIEPILPRKRGE